VKRKRLSVEQITAIVKQAELGMLVTELCRQHGVSEQSLYRSKRHCGGMAPSEAHEPKGLWEESAKLKRLLAPTLHAPSTREQPIKDRKVVAPGVLGLDKYTSSQT
jgi:putative transposase